MFWIFSDRKNINLFVGRVFTSPIVPPPRYPPLTNNCTCIMWHPNIKTIQGRPSPLYSNEIQRALNVKLRVLLIKFEMCLQVYATIGAFYLPLTVMIIIYVRIFLVSSRIARAEALSKPSFDAGCLPSQPSVPNLGSSSSNRLLQPVSQRSTQQHNSRMSLSTTGSQTPAERKDSTAVIRPSSEDLLRVQRFVLS